MADQSQWLALPSGRYINLAQVMWVQPPEGDVQLPGTITLHMAGAFTFDIKVGTYPMGHTILDLSGDDATAMLRWLDWQAWSPDDATQPWLAGDQQP